MSHDIMKNRAPHPARDAAIRSIETVQSGDREGWLANFHPEASLEDPVGISPMDLEGKGHHGIEAIFKAVARALKTAVTHDPRVEGIPSTKGAL